MKSYLRVVLTIAGKDLRIEFRSWERLLTMTAFAVLIGVLFHFSINRAVIDPGDFSAGMIWMTIIFAGTLGLGRTFQLEEEDGAFQGILLAPIPLDALFFGKVLSNYLILAGVTALTVGVFTLFFDLGLGESPFVLAGMMALGTLGFVALGTLFSALTLHSRMGVTLLPILLFPLLVPLVVFGVSATARLFQGRPPEELAGNLRILGAFTLLALVAGAGLFRFIVEE